MKGFVNEEQLWRFQKCLVCEIATMSDARGINDRLAKFGLGEITTRRLQGRYFLVKIPDEELMDLLKQTNWSYLCEIFVKVDPWSEKLVLSERVSWIEVLRVSVHCWNYESFKRIAEVWGSLIFVEGNITKIESYEKVELFVSIDLPKMLNELIRFEVGKETFWIRVKEKRISEMSERGISSMVDGGSGREEGMVSKSKSMTRSEPKLALDGRVNISSEAFTLNSIKKQKRHY